MSSDRGGRGRLSIVRFEEGRPAAETRAFRVRPDRMRLVAVRIPREGFRAGELVLNPVDRSNAVVRIASLQREDYHGPWVRVRRVALDRVVLSGHVADYRCDADGLEIVTSGTEARLAIPGDGFEEAGRCLRGTVAAAVALMLAGLIWLGSRRPAWDGDRSARMLVAAVGLGWFALQGFYYAVNLPLGTAPDERAHTSYAIHLRATGRFLPDLPHRYEFNPSGKPIDKINHLAHPPFYYHLLGPFIPRDPAAAFLRIGTLRLLNLLLATAGLGIFLGTAAGQRLPLPFHVFTAFGVSNVPMLSLLAGSVNNDNLALLGGSLAVAGALRFEEHRDRLGGWVWMMTGLTLALATKLTAGLHVGLFVALAIGGRQVAAGRTFPWKARHVISAALLLAGPFAVYAAFWSRYGSLTPFWVQKAVRQAPSDPSLGFYVRHFLWSLHVTWTGVFGHDQILKSSWMETGWMLAVPLFGVAGAWISFWGRDREEAGDGEERFFRVLRWAVAATLIFAGIHLARGYATYCRSGYLGGVQARYYFALMPAVWMMAWRPWLKGCRHPVAVLAQAAWVAGFFYSGLYYTWLAGPP